MGFPGRPVLGRRLSLRFVVVVARKEGGCGVIYVSRVGRGEGGYPW